MVNLPSYVCLFTENGRWVVDCLFNKGVLENDRPDTALWLSTEDLFICADMAGLLINICLIYIIGFVRWPSY